MKTKFIEAYYLLYYFQESKPSKSQIKSFLNAASSLNFQTNSKIGLIFLKFPNLFFLIDGTFYFLKKRNDFNKKLLIAMHITEFTKNYFNLARYSSSSILTIMIILFKSLCSKIFSVIFGSIIIFIFFKK